MDRSDIEAFMQDCSKKNPIPLECIKQDKVYLYLQGDGLQMGTVTVVSTRADDGSIEVIVRMDFMANTHHYCPIRCFSVKEVYNKSIREYKKTEGLYLFE